MTATAAATQRACVPNPHKRRLTRSSRPGSKRDLEHAGDQFAARFGRREYRILFVSSASVRWSARAAPSVERRLAGLS